MELYGQQSASIPQKVVIHCIELFFIWLSFWILFQNGGNWLETHWHIHNATVDYGRRKVIFLFNIVIFFRLAYMMFFLLKRKIPWEESISVPIAFAIYYVGYSLLVLPASTPVSVSDILAIALFVIGCVLNTGGEVLRNIWKKDPANKGQIYTDGFFKYARHINYFGDILWVTAYALITRNWYAAIIPVFIFCFFAFYNAPKLDKYLQKKYGEGYDRYAKKTKMLIPFIY